MEDPHSQKLKDTAEKQVSSSLKSSGLPASAQDARAQAGKLAKKTASSETEKRITTDERVTSGAGTAAEKAVEKLAQNPFTSA
jgi:hypothetical protein